MWNTNSFYDKSKLYIQKSEAIEPEDRFYIFWHLLALEQLIRSCVSYKHKPLLASDDEIGHLLYSLGIEISIKPKQRAISELINVLSYIIPELKKEDREKLHVWISLRNEELHGDADNLSELTVGTWSSDFYRISKILLTYLNKSLGDYYGEDKKVAIEKMILEQKNEVLAHTKKLISSSTSYYEKLTQQEKDSIKAAFKRAPYTKTAKCPSCNQAYLNVFGELIKSNGPLLEEGELYVISKYIPTRVKCEMCRLELDGYAAINIAGLGAEYSIREYVDPIETFNIDIEEEFNNKYPGRDVENRYEEYGDE